MSFSKKDTADLRSAAEDQYAQFKSRDPFPSIESALLSAADITDYAQKVGMIYPFDRKYLKPATYGLLAGGSYMSWQDGIKHEGFLGEGEYITIKKDSILFITLEPSIQLPSYIAARFNLTINHVYRGLLLGTGPMVDPGFVGKISIPLHNFTSNDYQIKGGEKLACVEFTKLAKNASWGWEGQEPARIGEIVQFDEKKNKRKLTDYVYNADQRPIESSIPLSVIRSEQSAKSAEQSVKSVDTISKVIFGINLAIIIAALTFIWNVYVSTRTFYDESREVLLEKQEADIEARGEKLDLLEQRIDSLKVVISKIKK